MHACLQHATPDVKMTVNLIVGMGCQRCLWQAGGSAAPLLKPEWAPIYAGAHAACRMRTQAGQGSWASVHTL